MELKEEDNRIVITKSKNYSISLLERFKNYNREQIAKEFVWNEPRGKEIW